MKGFLTDEQWARLKADLKRAENLDACQRCRERKTGAAARAITIGANRTKRNHGPAYQAWLPDAVCWLRLALAIADEDDKRPFIADQ